MLLKKEKYGSDRSRTCNPLRGDRFRGGSLTIRITSTTRDYRIAMYVASVHKAKLKLE